MKDQTIVTFEETYEIFNIRDDIKYGDHHDIIVALGIYYFWRHESLLKAVSIDDFFGFEIGNDARLIVIRSLVKNHAKPPIVWNDIAVEALRVLMDFINYNQVADQLVIFEE